MAIDKSERLLDVRLVVQDAHLPPQRLARHPPREVFVFLLLVLVLVLVLLTELRVVRELARSQ